MGKRILAFCLLATALRAPCVPTEHEIEAIFVGNNRGGTVSVINADTLEVLQVFETGIEPSWITNGFDSDTFFVSARGTDNVFVFSYGQQELLEKIEVGDFPQTMAKGTWLKK